MILEAAAAALRDLATPASRRVLLKSLGLTLLLLAGLWAGLSEAFSWLALPWLQSLLPGASDGGGWFGTLASIAAAIILAVGLALLIAPLTALTASLFLDEVADSVEKASYPGDLPGRALPTLPSLLLSAKFFGVVILGNLAALLLLLVPGVNIAAFFLVNGYLLGREYFEFAAMRHLPPAEAKAMRAEHGGTVFLAGLLVAGVVAVPIVNLATPIFAGAMMLHLYKRLAKRRQARPHA